MLVLETLGKLVLQGATLSRIVRVWAVPADCFENPPKAGYRHQRQQFFRLFGVLLLCRVVSLKTVFL